MSNAMQVQIRDEVLSYLIWLGFVIGVEEFSIQTDDDFLHIWIHCDLGWFTASISWTDLNCGRSYWYRALAVKSIAIAMINANLQRGIYDA